MKRMASVCALVIAISIPGIAFAADDVVLAASGVTTGTTATVDFTVNNGKKVHPVNFYVSYTIDGTNQGGIISGSSQGGSAGYYTSSINLPNGNHSVTIKVKLKDGSTATATKTVNFTGNGGGGGCG